MVGVKQGFPNVSWQVRNRPHCDQLLLRGQRGEKDQVENSHVYVFSVENAEKENYQKDFLKPKLSICDSLLRTSVLPQSLLFIKRILIPFSS